MLPAGVEFALDGGAEQGHAEAAEPEHQPHEQVAFRGHGPPSQLELDSAAWVVFKASKTPMISRKVVFLNSMTKVARMFGIEILMTCGRITSRIFCQ